MVQFKSDDKISGVDLEKLGEFLQLQTNVLKTLKEKNHKDTVEALKMIIRRIYPNHQEIEKKYFPLQISISFGNAEHDEKQSQDHYLKRIDDCERSIMLIQLEFIIFGFDFQPLKEKIEKEYQLGSERFGGFFRKKTIK